MVRLEDCPTKRRERPMRYGVVLTGVLIVVALGTTSGVVAAPVPGTAWSNAPLGRPACRLLGPPISAIRSLRRSPCRRRCAATGSGRAPCGRRAAGYRGAAAATGELRRVSLLERPILRRCPLQ